MPHTSKDGCCNTDAEGCLTEWERDLLLGPVENREVHMIPHEFGTGCNIKLDDGKVHLVTGHFDSVTCDECKLKWLLYVKKEQEEKIADLAEDLAKKKEELRVSQQAYTSQHRELTNLRRRREEDQRQIRQLREDVRYLRDGSFDERFAPRHYPVRRYPY